MARKYTNTHVLATWCKARQISAALATSNSRPWSSPSSPHRTPFYKCHGQDHSRPKRYSPFLRSCRVPLPSDCRFGLRRAGKKSVLALGRRCDCVVRPPKDAFLTTLDCWERIQRSMSMILSCLANIPHMEAESVSVAVRLSIKHTRCSDLPHGHLHGLPT